MAYQSSKGGHKQVHKQVYGSFSADKGSLLRIVIDRETVSLEKKYKPG